MSEVYTVPSGQQDPNLPPVNLPTLDVPRERLRITVGGKPSPTAPTGQQTDPWADHLPPAEAKGVTEDPWADHLAPTEKEPQREVGTGEAALKGVSSGASFGFAPALAGVLEAGGPRGKAFEEAGQEDPSRLFKGAYNLITNTFSSHPDPEVQASYNRGREAALKDQEAAREQHPYAFFAGQMAGSTMVPAGAGVMAPATLGGRLARGAVTGGVGGGLFGAGEATSEGKNVPEVAKSAVRGAAIGAPLGAAVTGALGPRIPGPPTAGQRAAQTAEDLGAPLPRGVASDSPTVQATTGKLRQFPIGGPVIGERVAQTQEAAGARVGEIAETMSGGTPSRSIADTIARPALQTVIDGNRAAIDASYNNVRSLINQQQQFTMPRTDAVLTQIMADRQAAGWANPAQGLEQFRTVAGGATFNGAHRARVDARDAGNVISPHPGYNAADFNRITRAMTADIRDMVRVGAGQNGQRALTAFDQAEQQFGRLAEQNAFLHRLINAQGEGAINKLLGSAKERSGNLRLLAQLRQSMPLQDFEQIGGLLLHELGYQAAGNTPGHFSLSKFATEWSKLSDAATHVLFAPQHLQNIQDIVGMGQHMRQALRETSTSHSASLLVLLDVAKDAAILTGDIASGGMGAGTALGLAAGTPAAWLLTRWLGSPATAASMGAWARSYRAVTMGQPTPARIAAFKIATRNMANTLGVPVERLTDRITQRLSSANPAQSNDNQQLNEKN